MNQSLSAPLFAALLLFVTPVNRAVAQAHPPLEFKPSPRLQAVVDRAVQETLAQFTAQKLVTNQLAITLVDLNSLKSKVQSLKSNFRRETSDLRLSGLSAPWTSFRGDVQIYPASVIKVFYLQAAHQWMEDGKLKDTEELRRAMKDMIVDSLNEATGLVVDSLTDTTSGPELPLDELEQWYDKRNAVNRYFASLGYKNINVNRKPWCEGPYGRERQSVSLHQPNHRNWLTTETTARLMTEIVTGRAVTPERSKQMLELLERRPFDPKSETQSREYTGAALPPGSKLWSKAGWTSETRHDAAYVELPGGENFILVTFTVGQSGNKEIIPAVARAVVRELTAAK